MNDDQNPNVQSPSPTKPDPARAPVWCEPARGGHPDVALFGLPGVEQLRAGLAGYHPRAPLSHLTGLRLVEVGIGSAVFEMPLTEWLRAPQGGISIGPLAIAADAALGCAVLSGLPAATPFTTSELSLRMLAPAKPGSSIIARGELIHARRRIALSEASLTDSHGRLLARGSSLCFVLPQLAPVPEPPGELTRPEPVGYQTPDPWERSAQGEVVSQQVWDRLSGLEVLRARLAGELGATAPVSQLTGLSLREVAEREAVFVMPATEWLTAPPPGRVQGGAVALLAETALSTAIQTTLPANTALATGSAMILPGRAASLASIEDTPPES